MMFWQERDNVLTVSIQFVVVESLVKKMVGLLSPPTLSLLA